MTMTKKRTIASICLLILFSGLALGLYFTIQTGFFDKALADVKVYNAKDMELAQQAGYEEALKDLDSAKEEIIYLKEQISTIQAENEARYNSMVNYYKGEIVKLETKISEQASYIRYLEQYILDSSIVDLPLTSLEAKYAQLNAFQSIEKNISSEITTAEETLASLPDLRSLNTEIQALKIQLRFIFQKEFSQSTILAFFNWYENEVKARNDDWFWYGWENFTKLAVEGTTAYILENNISIPTEDPFQLVYFDGIEYSYTGYHYAPRYLEKNGFYFKYTSEAELFIAEVFSFYDRSDQLYGDQELQFRHELELQKEYRKAELTQYYAKNSLYEQSLKEKSINEYLIDTNTAALTQCRALIDKLKQQIADMEVAE